MQELAVPEHKVSVVRNGIEVEALVERSRLPLQGAVDFEASDRPIVLIPARLHKQKGHADLLKAATKVPHVRFLLAGDGPERQSLETLAKVLGVSSRVSFLGERADVPSLLASSDVFVLPSLYEGLPVSVLEAMAVGTPVVATSVGGTDEAVQDGVTGVLVPPGQPDRLAEAIARVVADRATAEEMSLKAKQCVRELFSSESMAAGVLAVYEQLVR